MTNLPLALTSYVPDKVVRYCQEETFRVGLPARSAFSGALLFADISGFTALTERLAQQGPNGLEELTQIVNTLFSQILDTVELHGGDVLKFAGDALLALWTNDHHDLTEATHRAAQCGLAIHKRMNQFYSLVTIDRLRLRIGIACGDLALLQIGGVYGRWEHLLVGQPVGVVGEAEHFAKPGEVVMSPGAWHLIAEQAQGTPIDRNPDFQRLETLPQLAPLPLQRAIVSEPLPEHLSTALRGFIPGALISRMTLGQTQWLAELRRVSVLFVQLPDLDYDTPLSEAQQAMHAMQQALYRYEGSLNKISLDDKGATLVGALGLPPLSHEDDAGRAVQAALAIQQSLAELGLCSLIGVASGRAFCGEIGSSNRREYTMMGGTVNLAARLMQKASEHASVTQQTSAILCDETTYHAARTRLSFTELQPVAIRGHNAPVPIYAPGTETPTISSQSNPIHNELVGRDRERTFLVDQLQLLLRGGTGGVVLIEGEAGIGKSHLIADLCRQCDQLRITTFTATSNSMEREKPYHGWGEVFSQLFDLNILTAPETRRQHILNLLEDDEELLELAPLLNAVLPLELPDSITTANLTNVNRADATRDFLLRLLVDSARRSPKVIVLEDAHWFDSASWELALKVSRDVQRLLFVITHRPLDFPQPLTQTGDKHEHPGEKEYPLIKAQALNHLRLQPLTDEHILKLVCQRLGIKHLPAVIAELVQDRAQGNPFFSEELIYALRDSGQILIDNQFCRLASEVPLSQLAVPETVQGAILSRLDRLQPSEQLTLKIASVIGRTFSLSTLCSVYPLTIEAHALQNDLQTLEHLDITTLEHPEPELTYSFKHAITQEVVYNTMLFAQRRQLHKAVAEWYERTYSDDLERFYPLLSVHWSSAGVTAKAVDYLERAGRHALQVSALREATNQFESAIDLIQRHNGEEIPHHVRRLADLYRLLAETNRIVGNFASAREQLTQSLDLARQLNDQPTLIDSLNALGQLTAIMGEHRLAQGYLNDALALVDDLGNPNLKAHTHMQLGNLAVRESQYVAAQQHYAASRDLFERSNNRQALLQLYSGLGQLATDQKNYSQAREWFQRVCSLARELNNLREEALSLSSLAWIAFLTRDFRTARQQILEALKLNERVGDRHGNAILFCNLGFIEIERYDFSAAQQAFEEGLLIARDIRLMPLILEMILGLGTLDFYNGNPESAAAKLGYALGHPAANSYVLEKAERLSHLLTTTLPAETLQRAIAHFDVDSFEHLLNEILA